jgi:hypothetical protein
VKRWAVLVCVAFIPACITTRPSTQIHAVSKAPGFNPDVARSTLIIGVLPNLEKRRLFEETIASAMAKHGVTAECSYRIWPSLEGVTRETVESLVKQRAIERVSISRLVENKTVEVEMPGHDTRLPPGPMDGAVSYFQQGQQVVSSPGYQADTAVAVLETRLFETGSGAVVWTCRSETLVQGYFDELVQDFAKEMMQKLYAKE